MANKQYYIKSLKSMETVLRKQYGVIKLVLFGSVARDEIRKDSDLDICVETDTPNPFLLVDLRDHISTTIGCPVDIVRMHTNINPYLLNQIRKDGIRIF